MYVNIFLVNLRGPLKLFENLRKKYSSLKELREKYSCNFYADGDKVYAYGNGASELLKIGFKEVSKTPSEIPRTTCKMILEGFCKNLQAIDYKIEFRRFKMQAFDIKNPIPLSLREIKLFKGCEFRSVYLKNILTNTLVFGIILDLKFKLECNGTPCSYADIRRFISQTYNTMKAREIVREIRVKTGDLTPTGRINAQASKFRYESILEIMKQVKDEIELPDGSIATLSKEPTPIIIGV